MRKLVIALILLLYAVSFALPLSVRHVGPGGERGLLGIIIPEGTYIRYGWVAFLGIFEGLYAIGLTHIWGGLLTAAWLANPLLWFALYCLAAGNARRAASLGATATVLAFLALPPWYHMAGADVPHAVPHAAYWSWLSCMLLAAIAGSYFHKRSGKGVVTGFGAKAAEPYAAEQAAGP